MAQKCTKILPLSSQTLNPSFSLFLFGFRLHLQLKLWNRLLSAASALSAAAKMLRTSPKSGKSQVWSSLAQLHSFGKVGSQKKCYFYKTLSIDVFASCSWWCPTHSSRSNVQADVVGPWKALCQLKKPGRIREEGFVGRNEREKCHPGEVMLFILFTIIDFPTKKINIVEYVNGLVARPGTSSAEW